MVKYYLYNLFVVAWVVSNDDSPDDSVINSHFRACVVKLQVKYSTGVVPDDFVWTQDFPEELPFKEFAFESAKERAYSRLDAMFDAIKYKAVECLTALKEAYNTACTSLRDGVQEKYMEKRAEYDQRQEKLEEEFNNLVPILKIKPTAKKYVIKCFKFVMTNEKCFETVKKYFLETTDTTEKNKNQIETLMRKSLQWWNDPKKKLTSWSYTKKIFDGNKKRWGMQQLSFADYAKKAVRERIKAISEKKKKLDEKRQTRRNEYKTFLAEMSEDSGVKQAKITYENARTSIKTLLFEKLKYLFSDILKYYDMEADAAYDGAMQNWFSFLSKRDESKRMKVLEEAEDDIADAVDLKSTMKKRVQAWKEELENDAKEDEKAMVKKAKALCDKYFVRELKKTLQEEKNTILEAYDRHTMFHHINQSSFLDCGKWAKTLLPEQDYMTSEVFVEWEDYSLEKYMAYYKNAFESNKKYRPKDAKKGRLQALREIRDVAVTEWGKLIRKFQPAWKSGDNKKMEKYRGRLKKLFCKTTWMNKVRNNEIIFGGLDDNLRDQWHYDDNLDDEKKQPAIFNLEMWERFAKNDAIFGVRESDVSIRDNPVGELVKESDNSELDIMTATYCPQCGLQASARFPVYDVPYPNFDFPDFPDRNMYPNAKEDNKNLQFCGIGTEYAWNKKVIEDARLHFAVSVASRKGYIDRLQEFSTCRYVVLGNSRKETLPKGGCLEAFTRKRARETIREFRKERAKNEYLAERPWAKDAVAWGEEVGGPTADLAAKPELFRVDVRDPLWRNIQVRAPPGYRLVQYPGEGWTWQLEPYFDPLSTPLLARDNDGSMKWHPNETSLVLDDALTQLRSMCKPVDVVKFKSKVIDQIQGYQFTAARRLQRDGNEQFIGDKPYAWTLPVAPAVNAREDNQLNGVTSDDTKEERAQFQIVDEYETLAWYIEGGAVDVPKGGDPQTKLRADENVRRLTLRRNAFVAQQKIVYERCQRELSNFLVRSDRKQFKSLYRSRIDSFAPEKIRMYRTAACSHSAYKFAERPFRANAAAAPEEVRAWMTSILTGKPLRMYECSLSGKPCIHVEGRQKNIARKDITVCAQAGALETNAHFVTRQQYDIEKDARSSSSSALALDHDADEDDKDPAADDEDDEDLTVDDDEDEDNLTEAMRDDGWSYNPGLKRWRRNDDGERGKVITEFRPQRHTDDKFYAIEELEEMEGVGGKEMGDSDEEMGDADKEMGDADEELGSESDSGGGSGSGSGSGSESGSDSDSDGDKDTMIGQMLSRIKSQGQPKAPEEYERQSGTKCAMHALNNFLELPSAERFQLSDMQLFEPGREGGFEIATIGKFLRVENEEGRLNKFFNVSMSALNVFSEEQWQAICANPDFLGFIAKPATPNDEVEAKNEKESEEITAATEGLGIVMLIKVKEYFAELMTQSSDLGVKEAYKEQLKELRKITMLNDAVLNTRLLSVVELTRASPAKAALMRGFEALATQMQKNRAFASARWAEARVRESTRNEWHWIAIRKYTSGTFYVINSDGPEGGPEGPTVTEWEPSLNNFITQFSGQKLLIFASSKEARKLQQKLRSGNELIKVLALRRAAGYLKELFNTPEESIKGLLYPKKRDRDSEAAAKEEEEPPASVERAAKRTRHRVIDELYRLLSLHYD